MATEFELIAGFAERFVTPDSVRVGIGDDGAVVEPGAFDVVSMDTMVEEVHFRRRFSSAEDVGWKLTASNLSDIGAMGAVPGPLFVSMALASPPDEEWVNGFCAGVQQAVDQLTANPQQVTVVGGDMTSTRGPVVVTMTILGSLKGTQPVLRSTASAGETIVVSSLPGCSAAGLEVLRAGREQEEPLEKLVQAHLRPRPPLVLGRELALQSMPSAMIDTSDGLIQDLSHILEASSVGATIDLSGLEIPAPLLVAEQEGLGSVRDWILGGGEDYCLVMTVPTGHVDALQRYATRHGQRPIIIGTTCDARQGVEVIGPAGEMVDEFSAGFEHFETL